MLKTNNTSRVILVTGGSGLIGQSIKDVLFNDKICDKFKVTLSLNDSWIFSSSKDVNLVNLEDTRRYFKEKKPTHVIHLAAMVGGLFKNMSNNLQFLRNNILINDNVLLCCHEFNCRKVISCMSTCIFPDKCTYPIDETMVHLGPPHSSNYGYSYAKRLIDILNKAYTESGSACTFTSIIPTNVFGPHDNFSLTDGHVIPALIHKAYIAKRDQQPLIVSGSGKPMRQFIFSYDLARLIIWTLDHYDSAEPLILSVHEADEVSILQAAVTVAECMGLGPGDIQLDPSAADGQFKKTACNARLCQLVPDFRFTPFRDGVKFACDWFVQNYSIARTG